MRHLADGIRAGKAAVQDVNGSFCFCAKLRFEGFDVPDRIQKSSGQRGDLNGLPSPGRLIVGTDFCDVGEGVGIDGAPVEPQITVTTEQRGLCRVVKPHLSVFVGICILSVMAQDSVQVSVVHHFLPTQTVPHVRGVPIGVHPVITHAGRGRSVTKKHGHAVFFTGDIGRVFAFVEHVAQAEGFLWLERRLSLVRRAQRTFQILSKVPALLAIISRP